MPDFPFVRRIEAGEGLCLRTLRLQALAEAPSAFGATFAAEARQPNAFWHSRADQSAAGERIATFIAESANGWRGLLTGVLGERAGEELTVTLAGMWVDPAMRGRGVGAALIAAVAAWAASRGATQLDLWVTETNGPAIALYTRCGFRATGELAPLPHTRALQELRMRQTLAPSARSG